MNQMFRRKAKESPFEDPVTEETENIEPVVPQEPSDFEDEMDDVVQKTKSRRPKETAFTQQRIAAFNPVYTPKTVLPVFLFLGVVFLAAGGGMYHIANTVDEVIIYYEDCASKAPTNGEFATMANSSVIQTWHKDTTFSTLPQWSYDTGSNQCTLRFEVPYDIPPKVYLMYMIENFHANHRRYVLSFDEDQLNGQAVTSMSDLKASSGITCKPLATDDNGKIIYPCGLIANAMFNDTYPMSLSGVNVADYALTNKGISWATDKDRFKKTKYTPDQIVPPPFWAKSFPDGYTAENLPDISEWEEFQNWMRSPALPKFSKLIRKNENDVLKAGQYDFTVGMNWDVLEFDGRKGMYLSTGSSLGGRNIFLGAVYMVGGAVCMLLFIVLGVLTLVWGRKRRRIEDPSLLSWNKQQ